MYFKQNSQMYSRVWRLYSSGYGEIYQVFISYSPSRIFSINGTVPGELDFPPLMYSGFAIDEDGVFVPPVGLSISISPLPVSF